MNITVLQVTHDRLFCDNEFKNIMRKAGTDCRLFPPPQLQDCVYFDALKATNPFCFYFLPDRRPLSFTLFVGNVRSAKQYKSLSGAKQNIYR